MLVTLLEIFTFICLNKVYIGGFVVNDFLCMVVLL